MNVYFEEQNSSSPSNAFVIKEMLVDVVYGKTESDACTTPKHYELKTSLTYLQYDAASKLAYRYSGAPGYIKGSPLLIGVKTPDTILNDNGSQEQIDLYVHNLFGFPLRGADQDGKCYWVRDADYTAGETSTFTIPSTLIDNLSERTYFEDPVLTFEDDMLFGCSLNLSYAELEAFCDRKGWSNLVLLQNLYKLEYFGRSGNANPHY